MNYNKKRNKMEPHANLKEISIQHNSYVKYGYYGQKKFNVKLTKLQFEWMKTKSQIYK